MDAAASSLIVLEIFCILTVGTYFYGQVNIVNLSEYPMLFVCVWPIALEHVKNLTFINYIPL